METERCIKLNELSTLFWQCKDDITRVETEREAVLKVLSDCFLTRNQITEYQGVYKSHLNFLQSINVHYPSAKISQAAMEINHLQKRLEKVIEDLSPFPEMLLVIHRDQSAFISVLEKKRKLIKNAKTLKELKSISFGSSYSMNSISLLSENELESVCKAAGGFQEEVKVRLDELRLLVKEEKAELTKF